MRPSHIITIIFVWLASLSAFASNVETRVRSNIQAGDRMFSDAFRAFDVSKAGSQKRRLEAGTILEVKNDGTAIFVPDRRAHDAVTDDEILLSQNEVRTLRKKVSCPSFNGATVFANEVGVVEYRNTKMTTLLGEGRVTETFGNCERGVAIFQRFDLGSMTIAKNAVRLTSILPEVSCRFLNEQVIAPKLGQGIAKRAWGDCASGLVTFQSSKGETNLPTESLRRAKRAVASKSAASQIR